MWATKERLTHPLQGIALQRIITNLNRTEYLCLSGAVGNVLDCHEHNRGSIISKGKLYTLTYALIKFMLIFHRMHFIHLQTNTLIMLLINIIIMYN